DVIQLATGFMVPQEARIGLGYEATTVVETLGIEVGWVWYPWRDLTVRAALAFAGAVGAQVSLEPNFTSTIPRPFTQQAAKYAEAPSEKHCRIPTGGGALGWRLF